MLGNDQANTLVYGSNRMDTVSLTLALPDGRTVDLGRAPVTDQQGVAGLTGDVNNHYVKLFGAVFIGGALKGGMSAFQIAATEAAGAGQVTSGLTTLGNQATTKVGAAVHQHSPDDHDGGRPTLHGPADQAAASAGDVAGHHDTPHTEVGMTKAERLAAKIRATKRPWRNTPGAGPASIESTAPAGRDPQGHRQTPLPGRGTGR